MLGIKGIREKRRAEANRVSQSAIAEAMGVSLPTVRKWEWNPKSMSMEQAERLAAYLGCSVQEVFYLPKKGN